MPWSHNSQVAAKTKKANTPSLKRQWRHVANGELARGASEGEAIRKANAVVRDNPHRRDR